MFSLGRPDPPRTLEQARAQLDNTLRAAFGTLHERNEKLREQEVRGNKAPVFKGCRHVGHRPLDRGGEDNAASRTAREIIGEMVEVIMKRS